MNTAPSRREKRESKFYCLAEQGKMESNKDFSLYKSEEKSLKKAENGFNVIRHGTDLKKELPATVSWQEAFKNGIPLVVLDYCIGVIDTFPHSQINSWAQELFVIAARANYEKGLKEGQKFIQEAQKNNE